MRNFFEGRRLGVVCCDLFDLSTKVVRRYTLLFGVFTTTVADLRFNMLPDTDWVVFFAELLYCCLQQWLANELH